MGRPFVDGFEYAVFCIWKGPVTIVGGVWISGRSDDIEALFLTQVVCDISPGILISYSFKTKSVPNQYESFCVGLGARADYSLRTVRLLGLLDAINDRRVKSLIQDGDFRCGSMRD